MGLHAACHAHLPLAHTPLPPAPATLPLSMPHSALHAHTHARTPAHCTVLSAAARTAHAHAWRCTHHHLRALEENPRCHHCAPLHLHHCALLLHLHCTTPHKPLHRYMEMPVTHTSNVTHSDDAHYSMMMMINGDDDDEVVALMEKENDEEKCGMRRLPAYRLPFSAPRTYSRRWPRAFALYRLMPPTRICQRANVNAYARPPLRQHVNAGVINGATTTAPSRAKRTVAYGGNFGNGISGARMRQRKAVAGGGGDAAAAS